MEEIRDRIEQNKWDITNTNTNDSEEKIFTHFEISDDHKRLKQRIKDIIFELQQQYGIKKHHKINQLQFLPFHLNYDYLSWMIMTMI